MKEYEIMGQGIAAFLDLSGNFGCGQFSAAHLSHGAVFNADSSDLLAGDLGSPCLSDRRFHTEKDQKPQQAGQNRNRVFLFFPDGAGTLHKCYDILLGAWRRLAGCRLFQGMYRQRDADISACTLSCFLVWRRCGKAGR